MQKLHVETCGIERNTELVTYCSCDSKQEILTVSFIFDQAKPEKKYASISAQLSDIKISPALTPRLGADMQVEC
jgi:hypothetical protein